MIVGAPTHGAMGGPASASTVREERMASDHPSLGESSDLLLCVLWVDGAIKGRGFRSNVVRFWLWLISSYENIYCPEKRTTLEPLSSEEESKKATATLFCGT